MAIRKRKGVDDFWHLARSFLHEYMPKVQRLSDKSIEAYKYSLESYIGFLEEECHIPRIELSLEDFGRDRIKSYMVWMNETKQFAPKTVNLRITAIKSFLKYCSEEDVSLVGFYTSAKQIKGVKEPKKPIRFLSQNATKALLMSMPIETQKDRRNRMILILMYDLAARVQEIASLMYYDVHLEAEYPFVTLTGKGNKTRNVPVTEKTLEHLKLYMSEFHPVQEQAPLFFSYRSGKRCPLSSDSISLILKKAGDRARTDCAEIPENIHCHLMRKTRAMDLYRSGISLPIVMQLLGHESISTTSGFYAFATLEMLFEELNKANPFSTEELPAWKQKNMMNALCSLD